MVMCVRWNRNVINAMISVFILSGLELCNPLELQSDTGAKLHNQASPRMIFSISCTSLGVGVRLS